MNETDLQTVLARATDRIEAPGLGAGAFSAARRRRSRRRRGLAAGGAAALAVVVTIVVSTGLASGPRTEPLPRETPGPGPTPDIELEVPEVPESAVQELWDPRRVTELPPGEDLPLPSSLDPIITALSPLDGQMRGIAVVSTGPYLFVLDRQGDWHTVGAPAARLPDGSTALSADGTRVAFTARGGLWWRDLDGDGGWQRTPYPDGFAIKEERRPPLEIDADGRILIGYGVDRPAWSIDPVTGESAPLTFALDRAEPAPEGSVLLWPVTDRTSVAAVREVRGWDGEREGADWPGLIAMRGEDLTTRAYLPIRDDNAYYTENGGLRPLAWVDGDTVLAWVAPRSGTGVSKTAHLFTWNVETGELGHVSSLPATYEVDVAGGLAD